MKYLWKRAAALVLAAALCLSPAAQALTPDQLKDLLQEHYIDEIPQAALDADTVEGILEALGDPYTMYMTPEEFAQFQASMQDSSVVGIGISALADETGLLVVGVYEGSPAETAGLVAGDVIINVDGNDAAGQPAEVITGWLKGEEGTQ
ncbi:MAG: PDZ domain-containing protein, partial [Ruminiclostridium sp.]|nr:PDZ domain-containing protein [Ruminiclostridium sp.]